MFEYTQEAEAAIDRELKRIGAYPTLVAMDSDGQMALADDSGRWPVSASSLAELLSHLATYADGAIEDHWYDGISSQVWSDLFSLVDA